MGKFAEIEQVTVAIEELKNGKRVVNDAIEQMQDYYKTLQDNRPQSPASISNAWYRVPLLIMAADHALTNADGCFSATKAESEDDEVKAMRQALQAACDRLDDLRDNYPNLVRDLMPTEDQEDRELEHAKETIARGRQIIDLLTAEIQRLNQLIVDHWNDAIVLIWEGDEEEEDKKSSCDPVPGE